MKGWKKWMAVGCSHGDQIDPEARKAVLKFQQHFRPQTTIHLGDFLDLAAFRSGAISDPNSSDRAASISDDLSAGIDFLHELRPQHILYGNHEARLYKLASSPNALAAHAATLTIQAIEKTAKELKAKLYPYHIRSYLELGGCKFIHGYMYNVQAIRDHAEALGGSSVVMAHLHRVGLERARNIEGTSGYCTGMLARFDMDYASTRRATLAWSQGFAYGYYKDNSININLCERRQNNPWLLPM
jgi:nucleotide-binding universal stress UspA family protein